MTFDEAFERVLTHEGGFVNDSRDPGGATRYGITQAVARAQGYQGPMSALPLGTAADIYRRRYWDAVHADELPESVRFDVFDAAVNSGPVQAAKWLQHVLGVTEDGVIGPKTLAAAAIAADAPEMNLRALFNGTRLMFMTNLKTWPAFSRGWARRIASNLMGA